jgi:biopolymer transport protein ExbD
MTQRRELALNGEPNVAPMIDVLLVLLIIFMGLVPLLRRSIDAQLPDPTPATSAGAPAIVLEVAARGDYRVNRAAVPTAELPAYLRSIYAGRPDKVIFVRGDRDASYQEIVTAMDIARGAGVKAIGVAPGDTPPTPR